MSEDRPRLHERNSIVVSRASVPRSTKSTILGSGGIERVYRAHDCRMRRDVAVKVLTAEAAAKPEMRVRFEREARAMAGRDNLWT